MFDRTVEANAGIVRLQARWREIAAGPPASAADRTDPSYDFSELDAAVIAANQRGLDVLKIILTRPTGPRARIARRFRLLSAPGPGSLIRPSSATSPRLWWRCRSVTPGRRLRRPATGAPLPDLERAEPAALPSLPSTKARSSSDRPRHYTRMLNAAYAGTSSRSARTISSSPAARRPTATLPAASLAPAAVLAQGPVPEGPHQTRGQALHAEGQVRRPRPPPDQPQRRAERERDPSYDASTADLGNVRKLLRAAERERTLGTGGRHPLWATEVWWQSDPPAGDLGVPLGKHARWYQEALYQLSAPGRERGDDPSACRFHRPLEHGPLTSPTAPRSRHCRRFGFRSCSTGASAAR